MQDQNNTFRCVIFNKAILISICIFRKKKIDKT